MSFPAVAGTQNGIYFVVLNLLRLINKKDRSSGNCQSNSSDFIVIKLPQKFIVKNGAGITGSASCHNVSFQRIL